MCSGHRRGKRNLRPCHDPYWGCNPLQIRAILQETHRVYPNIRGAILLGDLPYAMQSYIATPKGEIKYRLSVSFHFYRDLDGKFVLDTEKTNSFSTVVTNNRGPVGSDIWIGVLPFYKSHQETIDRVKSYF